jgi:hypothetical protein
MKRTLIVLVGVVLSIGACAPVYGPAYGPAPSVGYVVAVGDRPYYTRGPYYVYRGRRHVWINGYWAHRYGRRVWVHGRYVIRG